MFGWICTLPLAASVFGVCAAPEPFATGYVEGDYTLIAPVEIAQITQLHVERGDRIASDDLLVSMERRDAETALAQAEAALAQAQSELANLQEGKRPEEISVIEAELASAKAREVEAKRTADRLSSLADRGAVTRAERDDAMTALDVAKAEVAQGEANLAVAKLPSRQWEIDAHTAAVDRAKAARDEAAWKLSQRQLHAPASGLVDDVIRHEGEIAGPSSPVLSVLADGAVKLRLYVPETSVSAVEVGQVLNVRCDGCADGLTARVTYVADGPEFTPPVIYSLENRQTLVYMIEARPDGTDSLKPGQIVDVRLPEDGQ